MIARGISADISCYTVYGGVVGLRIVVRVGGWGFGKRFRDMITWWTGRRKRKKINKTVVVTRAVGSSRD